MLASAARCGSDRCRCVARCPCHPHYHLQLPFPYLRKMGDDCESDTSEYLAELLGQDPAEVYLRRLLARDRPLAPLPSDAGRDGLSEMASSSAALAPAESETLFAARSRVNPIAPSPSAVLVPSAPTNGFQLMRPGVGRARARSRSPPLGAEFMFTSARGLTSAFECRALSIPRQDEIVDSGLRLHPRTLSSLT